MWLLLFLKQTISISTQSKFSSVCSCVIVMDGYVVCAALGQVMLYVDGMNGVMAHNNVIQWLYTLIASKVHRRLRP